MKKKFRTWHLFLILLFVMVTLTAWWGYLRVLGTQAHILSKTHSDLGGMLGRDPVFPRPSLQRFMSGLFQARMEKAAGDSLPFLEHLIPLLTHWKSFMYERFLTVLPERWSPVLPIGEKGYLRIRGREQLLPPLSIYNPETSRQLETAAGYYNEIATRWPMVRFYVFAIPSKQAVFVEKGVLPNIPTGMIRGYEDFEHFSALLSNKISYDWFGKNRPASEVLNFYYNTDHHLITPGCYEVYRQLHHLISSKGVDIGGIVPCKNWFTVPNVVFRGSYSRRSGGYEKAADSLISCLFELPDLTVTMHGMGNFHERNKRSVYESGKIPKGRFFNHPGEYFGLDHGLIEYSVSNVLENRNLLAIGDSNDNSIEPLLAAHFSRSFFVDVRHFEKETRRRFQLDTFIRQYNITDVLFIGSHWTTILRDPKAGQEVLEKAD